MRRSVIGSARWPPPPSDPHRVRRRFQQLNAGQQTVDTNAPLKGAITFQTWSLKGDKFTPYFTALIKDFETEPGTTVNWIDQPGDGYPEKVTSQITGTAFPTSSTSRPTSPTRRPRSGRCWT